MLIEQNQQPALGKSPARQHRSAGTERHARWGLMLFVAVAVYAVLYLLGFLISPSGRFPLLDGAENMDLARQIATGTLPPIPFYRAMLYPGILSLFLRAGVPLDWLPVVAAILGLACHLGSTFCVYRIARRAWASPGAGLLASGLFGLNPVVVYFAAEPFDTTLALFLFLAGLDVLHAAVRVRKDAVHGVADARAESGHREPAFSEKDKGHGGTRPCQSGAGISVVLGTACWTLGMLARPHYAIVLAGLPLLFIALFWHDRAQLLRALGGYIAIAAIILGSAGLLQNHICGEFRVMPTQGAYSLWVGNRPGANGRYYEQKLHLAAGDGAETENPARIESELLYRQETADKAPLVPDQMNSYWKRKTLSEIRAHPLAWLGLMFRKVYYLLNNFEQYNNKTFAIQKQLSPVLRWNPLGWGVTLILCATALAGAWTFRCAATSDPTSPAPMLRGELRSESSSPKNLRLPPGFLFLACVAIFYSAGVVLFFVSDRFRLPLLPFLCVGAGGLATWSWWPFASSLPPGWRKPSTQALVNPRYTIVLLVAVGTGLLTFSRAWGVHDLSPIVQDYILLSIAAGKAGDDWQGLHWAHLALRQRPDHPDALACAVTSFYNLKLRGAVPEKEFAQETWALQAHRVASIPQPANAVRLVQAVAWWKLGSGEYARDLLRALAASANNESANRRSHDDALGALLLAGLADPSEEAQAVQRVKQTQSFYLLVAVSRRGTPSGRLVPPERRAAVMEAEPIVGNVFPP